MEETLRKRSSHNNNFKGTHMSIKCLINEKEETAFKVSFLNK